MASRGGVFRESDARYALAADAPASGRYEGMYPEAGTNKVGERAEGRRNKKHHPHGQADTGGAIALRRDTTEAGKIASLTKENSISEIFKQNCIGI